MVVPKDTETHSDNLLFFEQAGQFILNKDYGLNRASNLLDLYSKAKQKQWNAATMLQWSEAFPHDNPLNLPREFLPISGAACFQKLPDDIKTDVYREYQAWSLSQILHGEQAALLGSAKLISQLEDVDGKLFASTQVVDEARHVEVFSSMLEQVGEMYGLSAPLETLIQQALEDSRWDITCLAVQLVIEGLALGIFGLIRGTTRSAIVRHAFSYVMADESRHVAFGRINLRNIYRELSSHEISCRNQFLGEACYLMQQRLFGMEVWQRFDLPLDQCWDHVNSSHSARIYQSQLFRRLVPAIKDVGLYNAEMQQILDKLNIRHQTMPTLDSILNNDEEIYLEYEARRTDIENTAKLAN